MHLLVAAVAATLAIALGPSAPAGGPPVPPVAPPPLLTSANAAPNPPPGVALHRETIDEGYVEYLGSRSGQLDQNNRLGPCTTNRPNFPCSVIKIDTVTDEVNAEFGVSPSVLTTTIGTSLSHSTAVQSNCGPYQIQPGQQVVAIPTQTLYYYRVVTTRYPVEAVGGGVVGGIVWYPQAPSASPVAVTAMHDGGVFCSVEPFTPGR